MKKAQLKSVYRWLLCAWLVALPICGSAQSIAIVSNSQIPDFQKTVSSFKDAVIAKSPDATFQEYDISQGVSMEEISNKIKKNKQQIILSMGSQTTKKLYEFSGDIPIVASMVLSANELPNNAKVNGIVISIPVAQQIKMAKKVLPGLTRIGVIYDPAKSSAQIEEARSILAENGLELVEKRVKDSSEVPAAFKALSAQGIGMFWCVLDATVYSKEEMVRFILQECLNQKIPVMGFSNNLVKAGALFAVTYDPQQIGQQCATLVLKVLSLPPATKMAFQHPEKSGLIINLNVAKLIGVQIPSQVLNEAVEVLGS